VLRRIFGSKRDDIVEVWRKLHNEELHYLHSSSNIIRMIKSRMMRWEGTYSRHGREEECMQGFCGETKGNRTLRIHGCEWKRNMMGNGFVWLRIKPSL
jgi:hypothetical protein